MFLENTDSNNWTEDAQCALAGRPTSVSAFKEQEPIPQYKATAKLAGFPQAVRP